MAYTLFTQSFGLENANSKVTITETETNAPAIVLSTPTGGVITDRGIVNLDNEGNLSVYIDTAKVWTTSLVDERIVLKDTTLTQDQFTRVQFLTEEYSTEERKNLTPVLNQVIASGLFNTDSQWAKRGVEQSRQFDRITSEAEAAGFLQKATLGPKYTEIQALVTLGSKRAWILDEFKKPMAQTFSSRSFTDQSTTITSDFDKSIETERAWATGYVDEPALRMKCLHTLNKLFVITVAGTFQDNGRWAAWMSWLDRINNHVFGNWRDLIESITYSPHMSLMLTYYANKKAADERQPDENYAREIMQLFAIGLFELNMDGSYKLDNNGNRIPTYYNDDIRQVARCLTGLTRWNFFASSNEFLERKTTQGDAKFVAGIGSGDYDDMFVNPEIRLQHYLPEYEYGSKIALGGLLNVPAGTAPEANLTMLHDALFNHPNTAPHFALRMIQSLVTSDPSPSYISRVAHAFADNGNGVRGDMKAIWMAILTDPEANSDGRYNPEFGRVRDGFDVWMNNARSFNRKTSGGFVAIATDGNLSTYAGDFGPTGYRGQPSIFSAYDPLHIPPAFEDGKGYAPEMQMWSDVLLLRCINRLLSLINGGKPTDTPGIHVMISDYSMLPLAGTPDELVERVNLLMCGGKMSPGLRADLITQATSVGISTVPIQHDRATGAMIITSNSPDYFVQL